MLILALIAIGFLVYALYKAKTRPCANVGGDSIPRVLKKEEKTQTEAVALETVAQTLNDSGAPTANALLQSVGVDDAMVISMDGSPRWSEHTVPNMEKGGFTASDYRRWRAVKGASLSSERLGQLLTPNRQYVATCAEQQRKGADESQYSLGAVGCALSHWAAWHHVANNDKVRAALVLEDDVFFRVPDAPRQIASLVQEAGGIDKFDFLRLDAWPSPASERMCSKSRSFSERLRQELGLTYSFTGYVVTKQGARKLLHRALPLYEHIDHHPSYLAALYPRDFIALMVPNEKAILHQNRALPSTIRT